MAEVALNVSNGFAVSSLSLSVVGGPGVTSKSIKRPSFPWSFRLCPSIVPSWVCWLLRAGVRRRVSSNDGMFRTGETGTVGLRMDFSGKEAVDYRCLSQNCSAYARMVSVDSYLAAIAVGILEGIKPTGAQTLTPRLLILHSRLCVIRKWLSCANLRCCILLVQTRRHPRPRDMSDRPTRSWLSQSRRIGSS